MAKNAFFPCFCLFYNSHPSMYQVEAALALKKSFSTGGQKCIFPLFSCLFCISPWCIKLRWSSWGGLSLEMPLALAAESVLFPCFCLFLWHFQPIKTCIATLFFDYFRILFNQFIYQVPVTTCEFSLCFGLSILFGAFNPPIYARPKPSSFRSWPIVNSATAPKWAPFARA